MIIGDIIVATLFATLIYFHAKGKTNEIQTTKRPK